MKILEVHVLKGPNFWSIRRKKLIAARLDIEEYEELPSNKIAGFYDRLIVLLPGLYEHHCSEGRAGGFLDRVKNGTWMGHIVEHIALELQSMAGMDCSFGRTRQTKKRGIYNIVFEYMEDRAGLNALHAAIRIAEAVAKGTTHDISNDIENLKKIFFEDKLGPSTSAIVDAADNRDIPHLRLDSGSLVQLGYGSKQKRINATITEHTSSIGVDLASDKESTKVLLRAANIPVPEGVLVTNEEELLQTISDLGFPLVIKPYDSNHGNGVSLNIKFQQDAILAYQRARSYSEKIIVEKFICGNDYRLLVINYKLSAAALRIPAMVTGNGKSSILDLVNVANQNPERGEGHEKVLTKIKIDENTSEILKLQGFTFESVPKDEQKVFLKQTANLSTGGTAVDVTDRVHPEIVQLAQRAARTIGLDVCGVDLISEDISRSIKESNTVILEVNAAPGFRMHTHPSKGAPRNVGKDVVNMLFPEESNGRIPIVAITGTNGKTTTVRLLAHIAKMAGYTVGYTTTEGIYIDNVLIEEGDCTGPASAEKVLRDKTVNFAVLECARGGMIRSGLAFDKCDVGIVTNVAEDHIGLRDINSVGEMARVKSIVAESVKENGCAILNADNDYTFRMTDKVSCKVALFSTDPQSCRIEEHCKSGGLAAIYENGSIYLRNKNEKIFIENVVRIPLTFGGKALFNIENTMAAVLAAYIQNIQITTIVGALHSFVHSWETTPGRLNIFSFSNFRFIIDYAHNFHGINALGALFKQDPAHFKVGIIAAAGDRRDVDIINIGKAAAEIFDHIIIRVDEDTRGRSEDEIISLLRCGIEKINNNLAIEVIPDELDAVRYALVNAVPGSLTVHLSDKVMKVIDFVKKFQQLEDNYRLMEAEMGNNDTHFMSRVLID